MRIQIYIEIYIKKDCFSSNYIKMIKYQNLKILKKNIVVDLLCN